MWSIDCISNCNSFHYQTLHSERTQIVDVHILKMIPCLLNDDVQKNVKIIQQYISSSFEKDLSNY